MLSPLGMRAPARSLPRRPATLVGLETTRPPAPTTPDEAHPAEPLDAFGFDEPVTQLTRSPYTAEEPTQRRARPVYAEDMPTVDVSLEMLLALDARTERSGVVTSPVRRFEATTPLATPAIPTLAPQHASDVTRVDTPRLRVVPPTIPPTAGIPAGPEGHAMAHAPTMMLTPSSGVSVYASGAYPAPSASGIVPIHAHPVHAHPYGLAYATPLPPAYGSVPAPPRSLSTIPPAPVTARRNAPKKARSGSRFALAVCTLVVLGAATVAIAESPVGDTPEVAPAAKVVRHESRRALGVSKTWAQAAWIRMRAIRLPA